MATSWLANLRPRCRSSRSGGWSGRRGSNPRPTAWKAVTLPLSYSRPRRPQGPGPTPQFRPLFPPQPVRSTTTTRLRVLLTCGPARNATCRRTSRGTSIWNPISSHGPERFWWGGEGSNLRSPKAAGLQPAAIDRSATSPNVFVVPPALTPTGRALVSDVVGNPCRCSLKTSRRHHVRSMELAKGFEPPTG
jgi:hypothetical protein